MNERETNPRIPLLVALAGGAVAIFSLPFAAAAGPPYLSLSDVNIWIVVFLAGIFTLLFAGPFAIERRLGPRIADSDARWERALLIWGGICGAVLVFGLAVAAAAGFDGDSLAAASGVMLAVASGLVEATLVVWLLSG